MRLILLALLVVVAVAAPAAEPPSAPGWPLWDGQETVEQYAKRAGVEPTKTLDLGNGVKLEMVLIPAGKFVMGTPEPTPADEAVFDRSFLTCLAYLVAGLAIFLSLASAILMRSFRERRLPRYYLGWFFFMMLGISVALLGATRWWATYQERDAAEAEYQAARARYNEADDNEKPAHEVTLSRPFYMGKFEVTQEQYQRVRENNPSELRGRDHPVEMVSWDDAQAFCKKASEKTGLAVRLPTEAEWEHACRAGTRNAYYTGNSEADLERAAWHYGNSGYDTKPWGTHSVGQKAPNSWALYDMHGNVKEWCSDRVGPYEAKPIVDPQGPALGDHRALRGGSWFEKPRYCRSACREAGGPEIRRFSIGFRVAADVPSKAP